MMRTQRVFSGATIAAVATALTLLVSGCASTEATETSVEGVWGSPEREKSPFLEFDADGKFSGTDGCNNVFGDYELKKDNIVDLGQMASTAMYCEGVDTWLSRAKEGVISSDKLVLRDEEGIEIGSLPRHEG